MLCRKPYMAGVLPFGCGNCLPCLINRRRLWTHRIMLEAAKHAESAFVTLTYASEHLPAYASLVPRHVQLWLKRFRKRVLGKLRYFLVGEYGTETWRPHYHLSLFGYNQVACLVCRHQYRRDQCDCLVRETWPYGNVYVGDITPDSASYIAGYVTKKMTKKDVRLKVPCMFIETCKSEWCGRHAVRYPEFARMSLKPGIGADAMKDVSEVLNNDYGMQEVIDSGDVPSSLRYGKKSLPLGRYLSARLRGETGLDNERIKVERLRRWTAEMSELFSVSLPAGDNQGRFREIFRQDCLVKMNEQKALNQQSRFKLYTDKKWRRKL